MNLGNSFDVECLRCSPVLLGIPTYYLECKEEVSDINVGRANTSSAGDEDDSALICNEKAEALFRFVIRSAVPVECSELLQRLLAWQRHRRHPTHFPLTRAYGKSGDNMPP